MPDRTEFDHSGPEESAPSKKNPFFIPGLKTWYSVPISSFKVLSNAFERYLHKLLAREIINIKLLSLVPKTQNIWKKNIFRFFRHNLKLAAKVARKKAYCIK